MVPSGPGANRTLSAKIDAEFTARLEHQSRLTHAVLCIPRYQNRTDGSGFNAQRGTTPQLISWRTEPQRKVEESNPRPCGRFKVAT
jgi:hypothetical protein